MKTVVFSATRMYRADASCDAGPLLNKLRRWVECASCCDGLLVAYPMHDEFLGRAITAVLESKRERLQSLRAAGAVALHEESAYDEARPSVTSCCQDVVLAAVPVPNWVGFTPALNALLTHALTSMGPDDQSESRFILFSSLEMVFNAAAVSHLMQNFDAKSDLVVGPELRGFHQWSPDETEVEKEVPLSADNIPWNTMALWDIRKLSMFGFLPVADGHLAGVSSGMEEVATVSLAQMALGPDCARAKLLRPLADENADTSPICVWDTNGDAWLELLLSGRWQPLVDLEETETSTYEDHAALCQDRIRQNTIPEETASQVERQLSYMTARAMGVNQLTPWCDDNVEIPLEVVNDDLEQEPCVKKLGSFGSLSTAIGDAASNEGGARCASEVGDSCSSVCSSSFTLSSSRKISRRFLRGTRGETTDQCILSLENHYLLAEKIAETGDEKSREKQREKVRSKQKRAQSQMEKLPGLRSGRVIHISC